MEILGFTLWPPLSGARSFSRRTLPPWKMTHIPDSTYREVRGTEYPLHEGGSPGGASSGNFWKLTHFQKHFKKRCKFCGFCTSKCRILAWDLPYYVILKWMKYYILCALPFCSFCRSIVTKKQIFLVGALGQQPPKPGVATKRERCRCSERRKIQKWN